jgi:hypothetical protein
MVKEVKMLKSAQSVKDESLLKKWFKLDLECIPSQEHLVDNVKDKDKYSMKKLDVLLVKVKK